MKKLISFLLLCSTICFSDLITTFDFDIEESATLSYLRPNWGNTNDTFYYNVAYFTVDTGGDWGVANTSIISHDSFNYNNTNAFQNNPWFAADTYVYLYDGPFIPVNPTLNLIAQDDDGYDGGNGYQFDLRYNIKKDHIYWAVITTYEPEEEIEGVASIFGPQGANINITTIPEPYAVGLVFVGGIGLLFAKRMFL